MKVRWETRRKQVDISLHGAVGTGEGTFAEHIAIMVKVKSTSSPVSPLDAFPKTVRTDQWRQASLLSLDIRVFEFDSSFSTILAFQVQMLI